MTGAERAIFDRAADLDARERAAYLDAACAGDDALRARINRMLDLLETNDAFMRTPVLDPATRDTLLEERDSDETPPERVGRYAIIRRIAEGGMGTVYEAEQDAPRRRVALKLIRAGIVSRDAMRRFALEAEVLGRLRHPGVAQILETDVAMVDDQARPYIAMELVEGERIADHARALDMPAKLELLARVCDAVHHAHTRAVIHRDIKPSNVLVDETGQPKVVDFGVARLLTRDVELTITRAPVGTLGAMSPEQLAGASDDVDTRTDVYALGALAYEVVAGRPPFDLEGASLADAVREITEREPPPPTDDRRYLDVNTVVATAMAKDRERRYASAAALASDLRSCAAHQPIEARPATLPYQLARWTRRNRVLAVLIATLLVVVLAGVAGTGGALLWALGERSRVAERAAEMEIAFDYLQRMLTAAEPAAMGRDARVVQVLEEAAESLDAGLSGRPLLEARLRQLIGATYVALGEAGVAEPHLRAALATRRASLRPDDPLVFETTHSLGVALLMLGRYDESEPLIREALAGHTRAFGEADERSIESLHALGLLLEHTGHYEDARQVTQRFQDLSRSSLGHDHPLTLTAASCLANLDFLLGDREAAREAHAATLQRRRDVLGPDHPDTLQSLNNLGGVCLDLGDLEQAESLLAESAARSREVLGVDHHETLTAMSNLAVARRRMGQVDEALALGLEVLELRRRALGERHPDTIISMGNVASLHEQRGDLQRAETILDEAVRLSREAGLADHPTTGRLLVKHATILAALDRPDEARDTLDEATRVLTIELGATRTAEILGPIRETIDADAP